MIYICLPEQDFIFMRALHGLKSFKSNPGSISLSNVQSTPSGKGIEGIHFSALPLFSFWDIEC